MPMVKLIPWMDNFKTDYNLLPDSDVLTELNPTPDQITSLFSGKGYWVHANKDFILKPLLKVTLPGDQDLKPIGNFPGPEDIDYDQDGILDKGSWTEGETLKQ